MSATMQATRLGVVTGLVKEAHCLRPRRARARARLMVYAAAGQPDIAQHAAERMLDEGADGLVSFGIAGGLDASLGPGLIVIGERVVDLDGRAFPCHGPWIDALLATDGGFDSGPILGSDEAVMTPADKATLFERTGALAVDMESHAVAEVAARAGVPFIAVRAIGDPATRGVPPAALAGLAPDGRTRILPVLAALLRRPRDLAGIWRLARDTDRALAALRRFGTADHLAALD